LKWIGIKHMTNFEGDLYEEVVEITLIKKEGMGDFYKLDRYQKYSDGSRTRDVCQHIGAYSLSAAKRYAFQDEGFKSKDFDWEIISD
jgi:hypothetical protein